MTKLQLAQEARRVVDEELAGMDVPSLMDAQSRAAVRLKVHLRTVQSRLAAAPPVPTREDIDAAFEPLTKVPDTMEQLEERQANFLDMLRRFVNQPTVIDGGEY
jgi:hypothetical protein